MGNYHAQWDVNLKLNNEDGSCKWLQHGILGQHLDVAALKLDLLPTFSPRTFVDRAFVERDMAVLAGSEVFVLGYPLGLTKQQKLPVWKRASIASEPALNIDLGPAILIDSATKKGMSGAPVFAVSRGTFVSQSRETFV